MLPQSFSQVNQKGMPDYFRDLRSQDATTQVQRANDMMHELQKPPEQRSPDMSIKIAQMKQAVEQVTHTPPSQLSPELQEAQRFVMSMKASTNSGDFGRLAAQYKEHNRVQHDRMIECGLATVPPLRDLQHQINALLLNDGEPKSFDIPPFREVLHKHFGREKEFYMIDKYTASEADLKAQLVDLHARKPECHKQLVVLLCQASLFLQPDHPKHCSCMLCAHIRDTASFTGSAASSKTAQSQSSASGSRGSRT